MCALGYVVLTLFKGVCCTFGNESLKTLIFYLYYSQKVLSKPSFVISAIKRFSSNFEKCLKVYRNGCDELFEPHKITQ